MNREDLKDKTVSFQYISEESMVKQQTLFIFLSFMLSQDQEMIILRLFTKLFTSCKKKIRYYYSSTQVTFIAKDLDTLGILSLSAAFLLQPAPWSRSCVFG